METEGEVNRTKASIIALVIIVLLVFAGFADLLFLAGGSPANTSSASNGPSSYTSSSSSSSRGASGSCQRAEAPQNWTTYQFDNARSGDAGTSPISCAAQAWVSSQLDGAVYAEPLAYGGMVFVATEANSVYGVNATSGAIVWYTHIGTPVDGSTLPCGDINPSGITGTPVIDPASGTLYAVAFEAPANHTLVAIDTTDGHIKFMRIADPQGFDPKVQQERAALSLGNGMVYIPYGGLAGDCGAYHGWVVGIPASGSGPTISYMVPSGGEAGIWTPSGGAVDQSGDLYFTTGNGASTSTFDHGNAVIRLSPTLQEQDYFAPSNWSQLNAGDTDLGSVGPAILPDGTIFQIGKDGIGYLINASSMGGIGGQVYSSKVCASVFGGTAHTSNMVFVPCPDSLVALSVGSGRFGVAWTASGTSPGPPIVTGNVVWALDTSAGTLHGYDIQTGHQLFTFTLKPVNRFTSLASAGGRLFVVSDKTVYAYVIGSQQ